MARTALYATIAVAATFVLALPLGILLLLDPAAQAQCGTPTGPGPASVSGIPQNFLPIFEGAAQQYGLGADGWAYLAALNYAESTFGTSTQPGVHSGANSAGAAGPMQIGIGGAATDNWDTVIGEIPPNLPGGTQPPSVYNEADAVYGGAALLARWGAPGNWQAALWAWNAYPPEISEVNQLVVQYTQTGPGTSGTTASRTTSTSPATASTTATPSVPSGCAAAAPGPGRYVDPFAKTTGLVAQRIDMGVDYDGTGPILALGNARITFAGTHVGGGWVCSTAINGAVVYQLTDGPERGRYVYVAEDVLPAVSTGQTVQAGQQIASFAGSPGCIETGWAQPPGSGSPAPMAQVTGGFIDGSGCAATRTSAGDSFSDLLHSLGAPYGTCRQNPIVGNYEQLYPLTA